VLEQSLFLYNCPTARFLFSQKVEYTVNKLKVDLSKDGLDAAFAPWEVEALRIITEPPHFKYTSGTLHKKLLEGGVHISQASVIYFLEDLANWGVVSKERGFGKGGERGVYTSNMSLKGVRDFLALTTEGWAKKLRDSSTEKVKGEDNE